MRAGGALVAAALLGGCASAAHIAPAARPVAPARLGLTGAFTAFPARRWWTAFHDPVLARLIEAALAGSPTLREAEARAAAARAAVGTARSHLGPSIDATVQTTRERFSSTDIYPPPLGGGTFTENQVLLEAHYTFDFFGRNRARLEAALGRMRAARAEAQAARVVLATGVAGTYFDLARALARRALLERTLHQREQIARLVRDRVRAGLEAKLKERQAQVEIPRIGLLLARTGRDVERIRHALAALTGSGPASTAHLAPRLSTLPMPALPRRLPAALIGRRADVVAARWLAQSALAGVREARARFYPNVDLSAFTGITTLGFAHLLDTGSLAYGVGPALTLPLFDAGALRANLRGRARAADAAIDRYNATVLDAVREVADAVSDRRAVARELVQQRTALALAREAYRLAHERYAAGLSSYLEVLTTENSVLRLEQDGADLKADALVGDVALVRALGGGYSGAPGAQELPAGPAWRTEARP